MENLYIKDLVNFSGRKLICVQTTWSINQVVSYLIENDIPACPVIHSKIKNEVVGRIRGYAILKDLALRLKDFGENKIEDFMNKEFKGVTYKIVNSGKVDLLKRIKDCANYIENDFIVCYGDTISNINIKKLIRFHKTNSKKITITAYPLKSSFGVINLNKYNSVIGFREKPVLNELINIGYFYFKFY